MKALFFFVWSYFEKRILYRLDYRNLTFVMLYLLSRVAASAIPCIRVYPLHVPWAVYQIMGASTWRQAPNSASNNRGINARKRFVLSTLRIDQMASALQHAFIADAMQKYINYIN